MELVPKGLRFMPRDDQLILRYLRPFCNNEPLAMNVISEVNIYDFTPHDLADRYEKLNDKEWFFFTPREKRYPGGKRPSRLTKNNGYWKITGRAKDITVDGEVIGKKSCLVYYIGKYQKTNWIMYEYTDQHPPPPPLPHQQQPINTTLDKALCKIHLNPERKRKTQVVVEEAVHVFMNPPLDSNHEPQQQQPQPQQIDEILLRPLGLDQEQLHQEVDIEEEEEEDVGDEVLNLLDLDEEEVQQPQEEALYMQHQHQHQHQPLIAGTTTSSASSSYLFFYFKS